MDEIIIKESKMKVTNLIIFGFLALLASIYILVIGIIEVEIISLIIGAIATLLFGTCFVFIVNATLRHKPLLVISETGITDMSTVLSIGFVAWEEIQSINVLQKKFTKNFIEVDVYDINKIMKRVSFLKKLTIKASIMFKYPPVAILLSTADMDFNEVLSLLQKKFEEHRMNK